MDKLYQLFQSSKGISTDTRTLQGGQLYFALKGENFNGNDYALKALKQGAIGAVVDEPISGANPQLFQVTNALEALQKLANHHRKQFNIPVLAITGSNGKTTSKELAASVLSQDLNVLFTEGNLNNHIGVPLTLLRLQKEHDIAIIEMGANKPGDIRELCLIAEPNFGVITNIGDAHLEGFGGRAGVVQTKTELYDYLKAHNGIVFIRKQDEVLYPLIKTWSNLYHYGDRTSKVYGRIIEATPNLKINLTINDHTTSMQTHLFGSYNLMNVELAALLGLHFGLSIHQIKEGLTSYRPRNNRSEVITWRGNTLIMDAYNANPTSVKLALESFRDFPSEKKIVILGDMLEIGEESLRTHEEILRFAGKMGIDKIILVGPQFGKINSEGLAFHFADTEALRIWIDSQHWIGYAILVKGSRGIGLESAITD